MENTCDHSYPYRPRFLASEAIVPVQELEWQEGPAEDFGVILQDFGSQQGQTCCCLRPGDVAVCVYLST